MAKDRTVTEQQEAKLALLISIISIVISLAAITLA